MDDLVEAKILKLKEYGKAKVYLINQDLFEEGTEEDLEKMDEQIKIRKDEWIGITVENKALIAKYKETAVGLTNVRIKELIEQNKKDIDDLTAKLEPYKTSGIEMITQAELNEVESNQKLGNEEWRRRRKQTMDVCSHFGDTVGMSKKAFIEKVELETDEQMNVVCPV